MHPNDPRLELIRLHLEGNAAARESAELENHLRNDPEFRNFYVRSLNLDLALGDLGKLSIQSRGEAADFSGASSQPIRGPWWRRSPLSAMAGGVVFGMLFSSAVWAYVRPMTAKTVMLFRDSFESGDTPLVKGLPVEPARWSGDFSEVVDGQQGVKPRTGAKMLRFLRADYEGKTKHEGNYYADMYRLIDVRSQRNDFADGGTAVRLSAAFNAFAFPQEEGFWCSVAIHALGSQSLAEHDQGPEWAIHSNSLAMVRDRRMKLDRDPATWQRVDAELRLPPDTEFLLIRLSVDHAHPSQRRATFDGHYLDDVRLDWVRRSPLH
jgi:hypothetical protein